MFSSNALNFHTQKNPGCPICRRLFAKVRENNNKINTILMDYNKHVSREKNLTKCANRTVNIMTTYTVLSTVYCTVNCTLYSTIYEARIIFHFVKFLCKFFKQYFKIWHCSMFIKGLQNLEIFLWTLTFATTLLKKASHFFHSREI